MKILVEILSGSRAGERRELDQSVIKMGRHPSNDIAFDPERDRDASSKHAELRVEGGRVVVYDLGSANGTFVDGRKVVGSMPIPSGTEVELGFGGPRCRISYEARTAGVVPATAYSPRPLAAQNDGAGKVGQGTVRMMIEEALRRARGNEHRWRLFAVVGALVAAGAVAAAVVALRPRGDSALRKEMVRVMEQQHTAAEADRAELQKRLDEMASRLGKGAAGASVARANHDALYLVTVKTGGAEDGFCTAFGTSKDRLVTNAHCVHLAEDYRRRGGQIWVVQNGHPEVRFAVDKMRRISGFLPGGGISPDVGWLRVVGSLPALATLAAPAEYRAVRTGDAMFSYGFPGRLADADAPEATFVEGVVGRVTTIDGRAGSVADTRLIQHSAFSSGGTSGSPIFNAAGKVVAVNTGGYSETVETKGGSSSRSLAGYNFGMRVDLVEQLFLESGD